MEFDFLSYIIGVVSGLLVGLGVGRQVRWMLVGTVDEQEQLIAFLLLSYQYLRTNNQAGTAELMRKGNGDGGV